MSSFKSFGAVVSVAGLAGLLLLSGCGFEPVHGAGASKAAATHYRDITVDNIPDRDGQALRNQLIDRLGAAGAGGAGQSAYTLRIKDLNKFVTNAALRKDATFTRGEMQITGTVELVDNATGNVVLTRNVRSVGGFNLLDNQFATMVSEQSVTEKILAEMGDNIMTEVDLYFSGTGTGNVP